MVDLFVSLAESCGGAVFGGPPNRFRRVPRRRLAGLPPRRATRRLHHQLRPDFLRRCPTARRAGNGPGTGPTCRPGSVHHRIRRRVRPVGPRRRETLRGSSAYERTCSPSTADVFTTFARRHLRLRGPEQLSAGLGRLVQRRHRRRGARPDDRRPHSASPPVQPAEPLPLPAPTPAATAFSTQDHVTGIRHVISPARWATRLAFDVAAPFAITRWALGDHRPPVTRLAGAATRGGKAR